MAEDEEENRPSLLGRDLGTIPCFRNSLLYGISGGIGSGLLCFMLTSRYKLSFHVTFWSYFVLTPVLWGYCRYQYSQNKFNVLQLRAGMQKQAMYEGTEVEKKMLDKEKNKI